ncbi:hypothetical protein MNBD_GAMMA15-621 [hydrothermal vent metagenome]|uniref:GDPGP1-like N-terminal domain-containing protein n=1 Tax=hydrothermal vent metagenome TaxID=652676 RepID=A0A3B0YR84_9ZZZZ
MANNKNIADSADFKTLFSSKAAYRNKFEQGLYRLLDEGSLNLFILVAANASFEAGLWEALSPRLQACFDILQTAQHSDEAEDDLQVFRKISKIGMESLQLTRHRTIGPWEAQFNQLRAFRPLRNSDRPMDSIQAPFDADGFNFNKSFMQQETIASGNLLGHSVDLYYNKYPFVELHSLLVPDREQCYPQYLFEDMHQYAWRLIEQLSKTLPGVRIGYNSLGAYASVNHLHLQLFVRDKIMPVELEQWTHNDGSQNYPVDCQVFNDPKTAWQQIAQWNENNVAYNLLYTRDRLYCIPRRKQGGFVLPDWSSGFSWYELCGGMITFNHKGMARLDEEGIAADLEHVR